MQPRDYVVIWLYPLKTVKISHHPAYFCFCSFVFCFVLAFINIDYTIGKEANIIPIGLIYFERSVFQISFFGTCLQKFNGEKTGFS